MPNTSMNATKYTDSSYTGGYNKLDAPAKYDSNGKLIAPVSYHFEPWPPSSSKILVLTESRVTSNTPGFSSPKRTGILLPNSFSYSKYQKGVSFRNVSSDREGNSTQMPVRTRIVEAPCNDIQTSGWAVAGDELQNMDDDAAMRCRSNIRNSSFNAAQALAERHQTANTVLSAAKTIASVIVSIRKGDVKGAAKALGVKAPRNPHRSRIPGRPVIDAAANHWLALQYGWKPLLQDVYGAMEHLAKVGNNTQYIKRSGSKNRVVVSEKVSNYPPSFPDTGFDKQVIRITENISIRYGVTYSQSSPAITSLKELGITNPALLAWELLPFSFVADWFLPIGNYLSSLDATLGLTFHSGYRTTFRKAHGVATRESAIRYRQGAVAGEFVTTYIVNEWNQVSCVRDKLSDFPSARFPRFKNPVSVTHAANAVALLSQLFKR